MRAQQVVTVCLATLLLGCNGGASSTSPSTRPRTGPPRTTSPPKQAEGGRCAKQADCRQNLKCAQGRCTDFSGKSLPCLWSLACLKKLSKIDAKSNRGYEVHRWLRKLSAQPYKSDCKEMAKRIAFLYGDAPWKWKKVCGAPPVPGVKRLTAKTHPLKINDFQVKAANVPSDERKEVHQKHRKYPDICKAWVEFTLTRPYQGWVIAKFAEQYDCKAPTKRARRKDPDAKPTCKTRPYPKDDRRYLHLHKTGSKFSLNFYISTPPEVCRKPGLTNKTYKSGCFCLGIDRSKVKLDFVEDPFLYNDEMKR